MKTPQAVLEFLRAQRGQATERMAGMQDFGVAVCEVFDELIRRAEVIAGEYPESQTITLSGVLEAPAVMEALNAIMRTVGAMGDLLSECAAAARVRQDPLRRFIARIETEGFTVAEDWTLTDTRVAPQSGDPTDPEALVQRAAEHIMRTERGAAYQERLARMVAGFNEVVVDHAQRVRKLIPEVLDG